MKKNLGMILILTAVLTVLTGCATENFFNVRSAMSPPMLSEEQSRIENSVRDYLGSDFKPLYLRIDGKYSAVLKCAAGDSEYTLFFCETEDKLVKSHCIFFEKKSGDWIIKDDIVDGNIKIQSACVRDVNEEGIVEIVIDAFDMNNSNLKTYTYQIQKDGIVPISK